MNRKSLCLRWGGVEDLAEGRDFSFSILSDFHQVGPGVKNPLGAVNLALT